MRMLMLLVATMLLLPFAVAKTPQECLNDYEAHASECCHEHGGAVVTEGSTTRCTAFEDSRDWQSACVEPYSNEYNMCMMGATTGGVSGSGCCGAFILLGLAGVGALAFARKA